MEYIKNFRGVHATKDFKEGDLLLKIPTRLILRYEVVSKSVMGKKIVDSGLENPFGFNLSCVPLFVTFLLE